MQSKSFNISELTLEEIEPRGAPTKDADNVGRQCLKCSHIRLATESDVPAYECPKCGAIYDKVEQLLMATGGAGR